MPSPRALPSCSSEPRRTGRAVRRRRVAKWRSTRRGETLPRATVDRSAACALRLMHQNSDVRNSILGTRSKHRPGLALGQYRRFLKRAAMLAGVHSVIQQIRLPIGSRRRRNGVMYEHRYSAEIAFLDPLRRCSTSEGLAAASAAPVFGERFHRRGSLEGGRGDRRSARTSANPRLLRSSK